ncbi:glucooligosaccharide oxidase [Colletotrichum graminicola]|nr:glucooligosaccharide oxidase [Colletotrichum graminicola]
MSRDSLSVRHKTISRYRRSQEVICMPSRLYSGLGGQDGSLCIDLQNLRYVIADKSSWDARIGAGALLGGVDAIL